MTVAGSAEQPLRVAVVGSGPAAFFVTEHLLARDGVHVLVDMFERLPTPFGLVRFGVAPDHQKIKRVTAGFDRAARREGVRFFGNVDVGTHVTLADLRRHYHQICFATGAQTDRRLDIPGEDLARSHPATEFVAWYNGHPEFRDRTFDLDVERVAVIGVGNVAVDVARILCRTPEELATTDITGYAEHALARSRIREVHMLGRRGPAQAAFTNPEVRELGQLPGADIHIPPDEARPDPLSLSRLEEGDRSTRKKLEILEDFAARTPEGKPRTLTIRFLVSPVALLGNERGEVCGMQLARNRLEDNGKGRLSAVPTGATEELPVELVFRSVGYHGVPVAGLPFNGRWGTVPNERGRVMADDGSPVAGCYVAGWIKRGPSGVIGTNKADASETVDAMLEDLAAGTVLDPAEPAPDAVAALVRDRQPGTVTYEDWLRLDALETGRGAAVGRPRIKFTSVQDMLEALTG